MSVYENVKVLENVEKQTKSNVVSKRKLHNFSLFFICLVTSFFFGFSLSNLEIASEVKNITNSWAPNITDLGKLKFVNQDVEEEVFSSVEEMEMPFENSYVLEDVSGGFIVNGLGGLVVKSCLAGRVSKITGGEQKTVYISHGKSLVTVYGNIDNLGVKEGDKVNKNSPLGVSFNSIINLKVLFRNKMISGLTVKDGVMTFE